MPPLKEPAPIFKNVPPYEEVTLHHADGLYLNDRGDEKQIVVLGAMHYSPREIADQFVDGTGNFEVVEMSIMESSQDNKKAVLARGFLSIIIRRMAPEQEKGNV